MTPQAAWCAQTCSGPAAQLHRRAWGSIDPAGPPVGRTVSTLHATDRCVVLGSTQRLDDVDPDRLAGAGMTVTRRRSGGAAVLVGPGEGAWVDVTIPTGDPLWDRDVGRAAGWVGAAWAAALAGCGVVAEAWAGPMVRSEWSPLVCFAGLGPGEVTVGGAKVVGISQRRTSAGVLFQCALLRRWEPGDLLAVLAIDGPRRRRAAAELASAGTGIGDLVGEVVASFVTLLPADGLPTTPR